MFHTRVRTELSSRFSKISYPECEMTQCLFVVSVPVGDPLEAPQEAKDTHILVSVPFPSTTCHSRALQ